MEDTLTINIEDFFEDFCNDIKTKGDIDTSSDSSQVNGPHENIWWRREGKSALSPVSQPDL